MKTILPLVIAFLFAWPLASRADSKSATQERIEQIQQEIARIEAICVPPKETPRSEVEKKFGIGKAAINSKIAPADGIPADSPFRAYEFCPDGTLFVCYNDNWVLVVAYYLDPYSLKGRAAPPSPRERLHELEPETGADEADSQRVSDEVRKAGLKAGGGRSSCVVSSYATRFGV